MRATNVVAGAAVLAAATIAAGCASTGGVETGGLPDAAFWRGVRLNAMEVDPPGSLEELAAESTLVAEGRIVGVVDVPSSVSGIPADSPVVALVVEIDEVIQGSDGAPEQVGVVRPRQPAISVEEMAATAPGETLMFFLEPAGYGGYYATSSELGLIAEAPEGLSAVLNPEGGDAAIGRISSFDEVEAGLGG